jgi:membrane protein implicated in regulation of membrane protease activity
MDIGTWWIWVIVGLALFGVEIVIPGVFFFMFFGVGAFVTGIAQLFFSLTAEMTWALFSAVSIVSLVLFRARLKARGGASPGYSNSVVGMSGQTLESIAAGGEGKVEISGSSWGAKNVGDENLVHGAKITVISQNGLNLTIKGS